MSTADVVIIYVRLFVTKSVLSQTLCQFCILNLSQIFRYRHNCDVTVTYKHALSKAEHLYSALHGTNHFKELRHGSHSLTCKEHHACLYLVSVHQMAPPLNVVVNI